jgi:hypothetical protein
MIEKQKKKNKKEKILALKFQRTCSHLFFFNWQIDKRNKQVQEKIIIKKKKTETNGNK